MADKFIAAGRWISGVFYHEEWVTGVDTLKDPDGNPVGGTINFTDLGDTPGAYAAGDALKVVRVKATFDGLEFAVGGGGASSLQDAYDGGRTIALVDAVSPVQITGSGAPTDSGLQLNDNIFLVFGTGALGEGGSLGYYAPINTTLFLTADQASSTSSIRLATGQSTAAASGGLDFLTGIGTTTSGNITLATGSDGGSGANRGVVFIDGRFIELQPLATQGVGIGITPTEKLHVDGAILLTDTAPLGAGNVAGTIRWNGTSNDFEGNDGTQWVSLTAGATGGQINTASNALTPDSLPAYAGLALPKVGLDLPFKVIKAGTNVTIGADATGVIINATGGGGGGTLDDAYAYGGPHLGRTIDIDTGFPVVLNNTAPTNVLETEDDGFAVFGTDLDGVVGFQTTPSTRFLVATADFSSGTQPITVKTGDASGNVSGDLSLLTGSGFGSSGDIVLTTGAATTKGNIELDSQHVLITTGTGGGVGIGLTPSNEKLEIDGAIRLASTGASGAVDGTIQWTGSDLVVRKAPDWLSLTAGASGGQINTASNRLSDSIPLSRYGLFFQKVGSDLEFKVLQAGAGVTFVSDADKITISAGGGSATLQSAYDGGGSGLGRVVNVASGLPAYLVGSSYDVLHLADDSYLKWGTTSNVIAYFSGGFFGIGTPIGSVNSPNMVFGSGETTGSASSGGVLIGSGNADAGTGTSGVVGIRSGPTTSGKSGDITIGTGQNYTSGGSGKVRIQTGAATSSAGGNIELFTGNCTTGVPGEIRLQTGITGGSASGYIYLETGTITSGSTNSGNIDFRTGSAVSGVSGDLILSTGASTTSLSGDVRLSTGDASGPNRGNVELQGYHIVLEPNALAGGVGIGVVGPTEKLEVDGAIKIAGATSAAAGIIQYSSSIFYGHIGSAWHRLNTIGEQLTSGGQGNPYGGINSTNGNIRFKQLKQAGTVTITEDANAITITGAAGGGGSLDDAYNTGSTVTVDTGTVQWTSSINNPFQINQTSAGGQALQLVSSSSGNGLVASTISGNTFEGTSSTGTVLQSVVTGTSRTLPATKVVYSSGTFTNPTGVHALEVDMSSPTVINAAGNTAALYLAGTTNANSSYYMAGLYADSSFDYGWYSDAPCRIANDKRIYLGGTHPTVNSWIEYDTALTPDSLNISTSISSGNTSQIRLSTGNSSGGASGGIWVTTGTANTTRGAITFLGGLHSFTGTSLSGLFSGTAGITGSGAVNLTSSGSTASLTGSGDVDVTSSSGDVDITATSGAVSLDATDNSHYTVTGAVKELIVAAIGTGSTAHLRTSTSGQTKVSTSMNGVIDITSDIQTVGTSGYIMMHTGNNTGNNSLYDVGEIKVYTGTVEQGVPGAITMYTGTSNSSVNGTGKVEIYTGQQLQSSGSQRSGDIELYTGQTVNGLTGDIMIRTGVWTGSGVCGDVFLRGGYPTEDRITIGGYSSQVRIGAGLSLPSVSTGWGKGSLFLRTNDGTAHVWDGFNWNQI